MKNEKGFSLIEVIISMVLVGLLAAVAGMGIVAGAQSYVMAKENAATNQKVQLAMSRLNREFTELTSITSADSNSIVYSNIYGNFAIARVGDAIKIVSGTQVPTDSTGDPLITGITSFTLSYNGGSGWSASNDLKTLQTIRIVIVYHRTDKNVNDVTFTTEVNPRNNGVYNGPTA